ncbi:Ig-like domain-containing protein [Baaleninema sp.]|uniref:Ig-like domain-containing protein n=1 Tax=Baaleninema sp. TaxID=3101197 RepID=UPI003CFBFE54
MDVRLDFAELGDLAPVGTQYSSQGLTFSSNTVSLVDGDAGGRGNFEMGVEEGSDRTLLTYTDGDAIEVGINNNLPIIVSGQLSLRYTSPHLSHAVEILDGTGTVLQTTFLPKTAPNLSGGGEFGIFQTVTIDFIGDGRSISIGSLANQLGLDDFDLTLNFETPDVTNTPPIAIDLSSDRVAENSPTNTLVGILSTLDPDAGDSHTYSLLDDAGGRFTLDGDRLLVADGTLLDFETDPVHTIAVRTTDSGGLTFDRTFDIQIEDIDETRPNQAPIDITIDPPVLEIAENSPVGTPFGTLDAIDPDDDTPLTFTLLDDAGGRFALEGLQIVVEDNTLLDFETAPSLEITVRVTDPGGLSYEEIIPVTLANVQEPPTAADDTLSPTEILGTPNDDTLVYGELTQVSIPDSQLLANDSDPDGDTLQVLGAIGPFLGGLAFRDGGIFFEPNDDFFSTGSGQFGYLIEDANGGTAAATVTIFGDAIDTQDALEGNDVLVLTDPVAVDLSETDDQTPDDTLTVLGFENVVGSPGDDTLGGDDNPNRIFGDAGNDSLRGAEDLDTLDGGEGDDIIFGEVQDLLFGGEGIDTLVIEGDSDNEIALPPDVEVLFTGDGDDSIVANLGDETLVSGDGEDTLFGGFGSDVFIAGEGGDVIEGGSGADIFRFDSPQDGVDTLLDFESSSFSTLGGVSDRIFVSASGFGGGLTPGVLPTTQFAFGAPVDDDDFFIFQTSMLGGALFYDPDGAGPTVQTQIAEVPTGFVIAEDIFVF